MYIGIRQEDKAWRPQQHAVSTRAGLDAFTEYLFRVRATNAAGAGRWSELARIATAPAPPSQPLRIAAAGAVDPVFKLDLGSG